MNKFGRFLILFLLLLAVIGAGGYFGVRYLITTKKADEQATKTISETMASSTDGTDLAYKLDLPTATTTVPSGWKNYTNTKLGYSISYPSNLLFSAPSASSASPDTLTLTFPKDAYFHWPLQDDVVLRLTASSSCPDVIVPTGPFTAETSFSANGYSFAVTENDDAGAGNRYQEVIYETQGNGMCYHLSLYNHGVNGAGFYVDGQALIQKYDSQHDVDLKAVISVFNSIVTSLRLQSANVLQ